jgi:hypothetical protein
MGVKYDTEKCNHYMSTDIVTKSDYEYLKKLLDDKCNCCIEGEKQRVSRVAKQVFEEMQSCLIQRHWNGLDIVSFEFDAVKYAELKKKYTESEDKG